MAFGQGCQASISLSLEGQDEGPHFVVVNHNGVVSLTYRWRGNEEVVPVFDANPISRMIDVACLLGGGVLEVEGYKVGCVNDIKTIQVGPFNMQPTLQAVKGPPGEDVNNVRIDWTSANTNNRRMWAVQFPKNERLPDGDGFDFNGAATEGVARIGVHGREGVVKISAESCQVFRADAFVDLDQYECDEDCKDKCSEMPPCVGGPVHTNNGNMRYEDVDPVPSNGFLPLRRTYLSRSESSGFFGPRWFSLFDARLGVYDDIDGARYVSMITEERRTLIFELRNGIYDPVGPGGPHRGTLVLGADGSWTQTDPSGRLQRIFDSQGVPIAFRDVPSGREVRLTWNGGLPSRVEDAWGNWALNVTTDAAASRITALSVDGRPDLVWTYVYDQQLIRVDSPAGTWRSYEHTPTWGRLAVIRDGNGNLIESHEYDGDRALTSGGASGDIQSISIREAGRTPDELRTTVQYANGRTERHYQRSIHGTWRTVEIDGGCTTCGSPFAVAVYDAHGNVVRAQAPDGYITETTYDAEGHDVIATRSALRPSSCDPATASDQCRLTTDTLATVDLVETEPTVEITHDYQDATWPHDPTKTTTKSVFNPGAVRQETFAYDALSGVVTSQSTIGWTGTPVKKETLTTATTLYNGAEGAAFHPGGSFLQAWWTLPQPMKQRKSVNGPRAGAADTTNFVYYPVNASVPSLWRGRLAAVRNPVGHVTRFEAYDIFGNATRVVDPNGVATEFVYDALGRVVTTTLKGVPGCDVGLDPLCATDVTQTRVYDGNGPLSAEIQNDSATSYSYDDRGRLLTVSRGPSLEDLRERIESTYNPTTGRKTQERVLAFESGTWVEKKRETYVYNQSEQLSRITHADGTYVEYTYGPGSQLVAVRDENHATPNTAYDYDEAGRLKKVTQTLSTASGGSIHTSYGYDRDGNLTSVTDPNGNVTTYRYDDFGRMVEQVSPVTGSARHKYDGAGQLLSTTLADGSITTRTYDPSGRVLSATSTLDERSETVTWTYDAGAFGKGRLTSMTDPTGTTASVYDRRGLLLSETKTIGTATYTTSFAYDEDGNRTLMVYPSGRIVDYTFDFASRPFSATTGGAPLVLSASYLPFGPLREVAFGNGTTRAMTYDQRYRLLTNELTGPLTSGEGEETSGVIASYEYTYDPTGNITRIADLTDPAFDRTFGYDDLNRLTTANGGPGLWGAGSYTYDAMGNMRSASVGGNVRTFTMAGTTPKIASVVSDGRVENASYDAVGNEIAIGAQTFEYSPRNSLRAAGGRIYEYDGRGIRATTIHTVTLAAFSLDVATASPNQVVTGTVSLTALAPAGGMTVRLTSASNSLAMPAEVIVAAGQASATFTMTVTSDAQPGAILLTATYATSLSVPLTITESPALSAFTVTPSQIVGGSPVTAEVTLADAAPEGGAIVAITAEREAVAGGTITIAAGATTGTTELETFAVTFALAVPLTASYGGSTLEASVQVQPQTVADGLVITPDGVLGGNNANGMIVLAVPPPEAGRTFTLTSSNPSGAAVPASIQIGGTAGCPDGDDGGGTCTPTASTFPITTFAVAAATPVVITANDGTITLEAALTVVCPTGSTPTPSFPAGQTVFIDDVLPAGAAISGALSWDQGQKASGDFSLVAPYAGSGVYQTIITGLAEPLAANDKLFAYVRVADCAVPRQIVLRARAAGQWVTAYWGQPVFGITPESINMGAIPPSGSWQRLDLLLRDLGEGGDPIVTDLELVHVDGQVWFDRIGRMTDCVGEPAAPPSVPGDEDVLIDDDAPSWVTFENGSNGPFAWSSAQAASGSLSLVHPYRGEGTYVTGLANLSQPLVSGSKLSLYALVDACSPPVRQIHIRVTTTAGSGTVSWGEPVWDVDSSTLNKGPVPSNGTWARLEVPLDALELDSGTLTRIDIAHVDGRVWFDRIALWPLGRAQLTSFVSDHESTVAVGTTVTWTATATGTVQPLSYRFERRDDLGNWSIVQNYGMQNTYTWTPTVADVGTNAVRVSVRNGGSTADFEDTATLLVRVVEGGEEGFWLHDPGERFAWWKRWIEPRVPVSLGVYHGSIATMSEFPARRHSLYTPDLQLLAETETTNATLPAVAYEYVWFGGQPLAQIATATGGVDWYFNDHLGTPILQTDSEANPTWRTEYDPYGTVSAARTGTTKHQPLRFPGQESDGDELAYNIFRWYRAGWGRYTQADPIGLKADINLFGYAARNPIFFVDRLGLATQICCKKLASPADGYYHCYVNIEDDSGKKETWGLHTDQTIVNYLQMPFGKSNGTVEKDHDFDKSGDKGICGPWNDDPCGDAEACAQKAAKSYPSPMPYLLLISNSNTFANYVSVNCQIKPPDVVWQGKAPGW